ncbi:hypothetical protein Ancab_023845 [Ancistrocladus abbreviatus]
MATTMRANSYGRIHEAGHRPDFQGKSRKRIIVIIMSSVVLVAVVMAAVLGSRADANREPPDVSSGGSVSTSIKVACDTTLYPETCYTSLAPMTNSTEKLSPIDLFKLFAQVSINELSKASQYFTTGHFSQVSNLSTISSAALRDCQELLGLALEDLNSTFTHASELFTSFDDFRTWLSAAGTYHQTCIDGLATDDQLKALASQYLKNSSELTSNALAIVTHVSNILGSNPIKLRRRLMGFPGWVSVGERRLLKTESSKINADFIVAKDGSGDFKSIGKALDKVPDKSKKRVVIYVKKGVYREVVKVKKNKWNVMMVGDGMDKTIVSGSLNFVDGTPTFETATFAVFGKNFIARDMTFRNTAGPKKHQAVALMASADQVTFYRCKMDAFQDTLYAHSNRQFYRKCDIYGTVDFIFGNSAVVFQNCNIYARQPLDGQKNTITAQGKTDPNQNTGISIHKCAIKAFGDLSSVDTYLGRPWKNYSTTVFMKTVMGSLINPKGWLPWMGDSAPNTIYYGEFKNTGPGSSTKNRVKWKGLRKMTQKDASKFTVTSFIKGNKWIPSDVPVTSGL